MHIHTPPHGQHLFLPVLPPRTVENTMIHGESLLEGSQTLLSSCAPASKCCDVLCHLGSTGNSVSQLCILAVRLHKFTQDRFKCPL